MRGCFIMDDLFKLVVYSFNPLPLVGLILLSVADFKLLDEGFLFRI